jgi:hypothetical protein
MFAGHARYRGDMKVQFLSGESARSRSEASEIQLLRRAVLDTKAHSSDAIAATDKGDQGADVIPTEHKDLHGTDDRGPAC